MRRVRKAIRRSLRGERHPDREGEHDRVAGERGVRRAPTAGSRWCSAAPAPASTSCQLSDARARGGDEHEPSPRPARDATAGSPAISAAKYATVTGLIDVSARKRR